MAPAGVSKGGGCGARRSARLAPARKRRGAWRRNKRCSEQQDSRFASPQVAPDQALAMFNANIKISSLLLATPPADAVGGNEN